MRGWFIREDQPRIRIGSGTRQRKPQDFAAGKARSAFTDRRVSVRIGYVFERRLAKC